MSKSSRSRSFARASYCRAILANCLEFMDKGKGIATAERLEWAGAVLRRWEAAPRERAERNRKRRERRKARKMAAGEQKGDLT
jgi:hypothetical protein